MKELSRLLWTLYLILTLKGIIWSSAFSRAATSLPLEDHIFQGRRQYHDLRLWAPGARVKNQKELKMSQKGLNSMVEKVIYQTSHQGRIRVGQGGIKKSSRPLRVLHISSIEKASSYFNNLCDFIDPREIEISSVTFAPQAGFVEELQQRGVRAYALDALSRRRYPYAAREIWRIIEQEQIDIVHTHLFDATLIGLVIAKLRGRKVVVTRHHSDALYYLQEKVKRKFYLSMERYINNHADHIIAPSRMVRDILIEQEGVSPAKVSLIPYGQTADRFDAITSEVVARVKTELGMADRLALVCTSRLYERKGHVYLFEALAPLVRSGLKTTLYLVGTGAYREQLEKLADQFGLQNHVRFLGWRDDALAIMAAADIIVHPSCEDALSQAVIESLMLERPIIATDISGVRDSLDDGRYGMIVPPANADAFRAALKQVMAHLDEARERARLGRKHIIEYMDAGRVAHAYAECYKTVWG
jgi:glycosyltransferase involved in cell wall biosynthesis